MVTENTTPNRGYQEPAVGNTLEVDVGRLIAALRAIDVDVANALAAIMAKAGLNSPAFTGTPTAPTAAPGTDSGQLATTAFVKAALTALVDGAPGALDTLNELAAAIGDDPNFAATIAALIGTKADAAATTAALAGKEDLLSAATSDNTFDDTDGVVYLTGTTRKRGTLAGLITSIFKTTRTIANGQFAAATFKLFNAAGTPRALTFLTTALTADRKITMPDKDIDLGSVVIRGTTGELTLSGTQFDITSIPTDARRIRIKFNEVSFSAASTSPAIQIGTSSGIESTGYKTSGALQAASTSSTATYTESFRLSWYSTTSGPQSGVMELDRIGTSNRWVMIASTKSSDASGALSSSGGYKSLPGNLDRLRITTAAGTATLSGSVEVDWEK